jgi:chromosome segregation ATPase
MAVLAGGYGSWQHHVGEDNRRKIRALEKRVTHLEARIDQLEAKVGDDAGPVEPIIVAARDAAVERVEDAERDLAEIQGHYAMARERTERAEADLAAAHEHADRTETKLAAARQQLDQVRAAFQRWSGGPDDEFEQTMRDLLDAPARPAGHDETGGES